MAKKLILVDEEMYRALITQQKDDDINYNLIKKNMENALRKPAKNLSTKKVQYQQELRRYLKARKEKLNKPVKAKLSNNANVVLTGGPNSAASIINENGDIEDQVSLNDTLRTDVSEHGDDFATPRTHRNPYLPSTPAQNLFAYVMNAPERFGVTTGGQILRGGREINHSNILEVIFHILNGGPGTVSPHGTKTFYNRIKDDPQFKRFFNEHKTASRRQSGSRIQSGRGGFKPNKWK